MAPWFSARQRLAPSRWIALSLVALAMWVGPIAAFDRAEVRSAGNAALAKDLAACPFDVGLSLVREVGVPGVPATGDGPLPISLDATSRTLSTAVSPPNGPEILTLLGGTFDMSNPTTGRTVPVQLVSRTGASSHIERTTTGGSSTGVFVQTVSATQLGLTGPGAVEISRNAATVPASVEAIVTNLSDGVAPNFWCSLNPLIYGQVGVNETPIAVVDQDLLLSMLRQTGTPTVTALFEYPPAPATWNLSTAPGVLARYGRVSKDLHNPSSNLGKLVGSDGGSQANQLNTLNTARREMTASQGAIRPFTAAALLIALAALALTAKAWLRPGAASRRTLVRHGVGVVALASKGIVEMVIPVFVGGTLGAVGIWIVERRINAAETRHSITVLRATAAIVGPMIVIAIVSTIDAIVVVRPKRSQRRWLFPAAIFGLTIAAGTTVYAFGLRVDASKLRRQFLGTDILSALAPVCMIVLCSVVVVRLLVSRRAARRSGWLPPMMWLAWRRICGDRDGLREPLACVASSLALAFLATANIAGVAQARTDRTTLGLGASTVYVLDTAPTATAVAAFGSPATVVSRLTESTVLARGKPPVDVLGVDPSTFRSEAFWRDRFSNTALSALLGKLADPADSTAAIVVSSAVPDRFQVTLSGDTENVTIELHTVARSRYFPGQDTTGQRPLVVVNRQLLLDRGINAGAEVWTRAAPVEARRLTSAGLVVAKTTLASTVPLDGVEATTNSLRAARYVAVGTLVASVLALLAGWRADRRRNQRETSLLGVLGVTLRCRALEAAAELLLSGMVVIVAALLAGEIVDRALSTFADQTPFAQPAAGHGSLMAPFATSVIVLVGCVVLVAGSTWWQPGTRNPYRELAHHG